MTSNLWNTKEIAVYLNVKESTIRYWVHIGYIPHVKFSGAVRYREQEINEWLAKRSVPGKTHRAKKMADEILSGRHRRSS